jgi:hypothetical protein
VISIKNPKVEKWIEAILQRSKFADPQEYLESRVKQDYEAVMKNKKLA